MSLDCNTYSPEGVVFGATRRTPRRTKAWDLAKFSAASRIN